MSKYLIIIVLSFIINCSSQAKHNEIIQDFHFWQKYEVKGSNDAYEFKKNLIQDQDVIKEIQNNERTGLTSYIFYINNEIIIDEKSLPDYVTKNNNLLLSNSMGKSLSSYILGHAICKGYIENVDVKLDDWSILKNTLYDGQILIDILNMQAGDQHILGEKYGKRDIFLHGTKININTYPLKDVLEFKQLQNSKKKSKTYNYNALATNLILNYAIFKSGDNFQNLLDEIFRDKVKVKNNFYLHKSTRSNILYPHSESAWFQFHATRYDYLRIAKTIMDDWNSNNCVGKYLKTIYERRIKKNFKEYKPTHIHPYSYTYGGQFHFDFVGMKKRKILGLDGWGGQQILIDVEKKAIAVVHSNWNHYKWKKIVYKKFKDLK